MHSPTAMLRHRVAAGPEAPAPAKVDGRRTVASLAVAAPPWPRPDRKPQANIGQWTAILSTECHRARLYVPKQPSALSARPRLLLPTGLPYLQRLLDWRPTSQTYRTSHGSHNPCVAPERLVVPVL